MSESGTMSWNSGFGHRGFHLPVHTGVFGAHRKTDRLGSESVFRHQNSWAVVGERPSRRKWKGSRLTEGSGANEETDSRAAIMTRYRFCTLPRSRLQGSLKIRFVNTAAFSGSNPRRALKIHF